jgi:hypothetical protein
MLLERFDPPGFLNDFNDQQKLAWSEFISKQFDQASQGYPDEIDFDGPRDQFYNPTKVDTDEDVKLLDIPWTAFPRNVTVSSASDTQRWRRADSSRDLQDEYCEWSIERDDQTNKIVRVTFTCEGPEYWEFLANTSPEKALSLYQQFISSKVKIEDLFTADGKYNKRNRWNSTTVDGAMHLIQRANTLGAEIELAGGSSVVREIDGVLLTDEQELIQCGKYGGPNRHSDPFIGAMVNSLTRQKADVTLANPVGLYFAGLSTEGWQTPDGTNPLDFWKYLRGDNEKYVRAVYEVPQELGYVVGDITIQGRPIVFGAQIADFISIKLTGVACRFGKSKTKPMTGCRTPKAAVTNAATFSDLAPMSVENFIAQDTPKNRL